MLLFLGRVDLFSNVINNIFYRYIYYYDLFCFVLVGLFGSKGLIRCFGESWYINVLYIVILIGGRDF